MDNHVYEVGVGLVPATLLFILVHYERRIDSTNYTCSICNTEIDIMDRVGDQLVKL